MNLRRAEFREASLFIADWHSRLPITKGVPASFVYMADHNGIPVAAALWGNTSARGLPRDWLELRRMAVRTDGFAPHCAASWFLAAMRKDLRRNAARFSRLVSYQDVDVHSGTIYRAAGWVPAFFSKPRARRRDVGLGKRKVYRTDSNGIAPAAAGKVRWEIALKKGDPLPYPDPVLAESLGWVSPS